MQITPVEFDWIEQIGRGHDIGFVAQQVEKVLPELVYASTNISMEMDGDSSDYLSVDYARLTVYLVQAIQELKAEIEELKKK